MWYTFEDYTFDAQRYELYPAGTPVPLRPKLLEVLAYPLVHHDRIVPRDELLTHLWAGRFVGDATLNSCIKEVRRAIGDSVAVLRLLRTVCGRGYRFVAAVEDCTNVQAAMLGGPTQSPLDTVVTPPSGYQRRDTSTASAGGGVSA